MSSVFEHLDQAVERLAALRDELLADECAPDRAARLAAVFDVRGAGVVAGLRAGAACGWCGGRRWPRRRARGRTRRCGRGAPPRSGPAGAG